MKCRCAALSTWSEWPPGDCHAATAGTSGSTRGSGGPGGARSVCSMLSDAPRVIAPVLPPAAAACIAAESTGAYYGDRDVSELLWAGAPLILLAALIILPVLGWYLFPDLGLSLWFGAVGFLFVFLTQTREGAAIVLSLAERLHLA